MVKINWIKVPLAKGATYELNQTRWSSEGRFRIRCRGEWKIYDFVTGKASKGTLTHCQHWALGVLVLEADERKP